MLYSATIEIDEDGSASGWFPDVPGCIFAGDNPEETFHDAKSALEAHFEFLAEKGEDIPEASRHWNTESDPTPHKSGCVRNGFFVEVDTTKYLGKSERINITMPHLLIEKIDKAVGQSSRYSSRSHFIAEAARKELSNI